MSTSPTSDLPAELDPFEFEALELSSAYKDWILSEFREPLTGRQSLAEVGSGVGHFTTAVQTLVPSLTAVEPEAGYYEKLRRVLRDRDRLISGYSTDLADRSVDAIVSVNVLEHIEEDAAELSVWESKLMSGGVVCVLVPARREIYAPIDADMGHFRRYSRRELSDKITAAGFEVVDCSYFNFLGYFLWWAKFKVLRARGFDPGQVKFYNSNILPVAKALDRWGGSKLTGQSVICIAKKE